MSREEESFCIGDEGKKLIADFVTYLNEFSKTFQTDSGIEILKRFSDALKIFESNKFLAISENCKSVENDDADSIINSVNEWILVITTSFTSSQFALDSEHIYFEIIVLLSLIKMKFLEEDLIEFTKTSINMINYGMKLIKDCIAHQFLSKAEFYIEKCQNSVRSLLSKYSCRDIPIIKSIKENQTVLELFRLEYSFQSKSLNVDLCEIQELKTKLHDFSYHYEYFVRLCYNIGVGLAKQDLFEQAISVIEIVRDVQYYHLLSKQDAISIHSLLAAIYLKYLPEKHWRKCLESLKSASEIDPKPVFFINMLRVAFYSNEDDVLQDVLRQIRKLDHVAIEFVLEVTDELRQNERNKEAIEFCQDARLKIDSVSEKLAIVKEELSLHFSTKSYDSVSGLLVVVVSLSERNPLDVKAVCMLCRIIAKNAAEVFDSGHYEHCLLWYKECCRLLKESNREMHYYFQQRICLCYVELKNAQLAKEAFGRIEDRKKDSMNVYLALNIAFMNKDKDLAETALQWAGEDNPHSERVLLSCCRRALEYGHQGAFLCTLLEEIVGRRCSSWRLGAKVIQCLIKIHLKTAETEETKEKIIVYLDKAQDILKNVSHCGESQWLSRISWNLALTSTNPEERFRFMLHSCLFLKGPQGTLKAQTLLMTAAAGIELMRTTTDQDRRLHVYGQVSSLLDNSFVEGAEQPPPNIRTPLLLYSFETHLLGGASSTAERLLGTLVRCADAAALLDAAGVAYGVSRTHKFVPVALKGAIAKVMDGKPLDCALLSKLQTFLLQVLFYAHEYVSPVMAEETLRTLEEIAQLLEDDSVSQEYPEIEVLWMAVRSWNTGIRLLSCGQGSKGRPWCALALRLAQRLPAPLKALHEKKMSSLWAAHFGEDQSTNCC